MFFLHSGVSKERAFWKVGGRELEVVCFFKVVAFGESSGGLFTACLPMCKKLASLLIAVEATICQCFV